MLCIGLCAQYHFQLYNINQGFFVSVKYNIDLSKKAADEIMASVEYRTVYGSRGKYTRESETV